MDRILESALHLCSPIETMDRILESALHLCIIVLID